MNIGTLFQSKNSSEKIFQINVTIIGLYRIKVKRENQEGGESNGKDIQKSEQKDNISNKGGII